MEGILSELCPLCSCGLFPFLGLSPRQHFFGPFLKVFLTHLYNHRITASLFLFQFAVIEYYAYKLASCTLVILISNYEMLPVASNVSDIQPLKEFIEVMEGIVMRASDF